MINIEEYMYMYIYIHVVQHLETWATNISAHFDLSLHMIDLFQGAKQIAFKPYFTVLLRIDKINKTNLQSLNFIVILLVDYYIYQDEFYRIQFIK